MRPIVHFFLQFLKVPEFVFAKIHNFLLLYSTNTKYQNYPLVTGKLNIKGTGTILIGNNVTINSNINSNPVGLSTGTILFAYPGSRIKIGNNIGISNSLICAMKEIIIEDNVLLGGGTQIFDNDFHSILYKKRIERPDTNIKIKPVFIKQGAFIGCNSIITKGVTIGERSIVGAGSVVVKDIPADEIWAGNPAVFIKKIEN